MKYKKLLRLYGEGNLRLRRRRGRKRAMGTRASVTAGWLSDKTAGEDLELVLGESEAAVEVTSPQAGRCRLVASNPTEQPMTLQLEFPTADYRYQDLRWTEGKPGKFIIRCRCPRTARRRWRAGRGKWTISRSPQVSLATRRGHEVATGRERV